jgi:hypothetical protein
MQPGSKSRLVLYHVMSVIHLNKLHCYHHQQPPQMHQNHDIHYFHLHALHHLKIRTTCKDDVFLAIQKLQAMVL